MRSRRLLSFTLIASLLLAVPVGAQFPVEPPSPADPPEALEALAPFNLSYVDGRVDVVRPEGVQAAQAPDILDEDERLVTAEGRAELVLSDGSVAHVDRQSDVRVDLGVRLRLVSGRLVIHTPSDIDALFVSTPAGPVRLSARGTYDLSADDLRGDTTIAVREGHAALVAADSETPIAADGVLRVDPRDLQPRWARGAPRDAFTEWAERRMGATMTAARAPLPAPLQPWAADLEANGQWSTLSPYGPVWFPSAGPSWRPYQYGSWRFTRHGWTWIDADRWAWPVHHYGRWGRHDARGWYWIPQRAWGPAWVGWAVAANHVAWSPLGWDRRPLVEFSIGARGGPVGLFASSWSILPRQAFGRRGPIYRDLQDPVHLSGPVLGGFVSQMVGPRGPAGPGDRFGVRPDRRGATPYAPRPSFRQPGPPIAYQPRSVEPAPAERRPDGSSLQRRPGDAPPRVDPLPVDPAPGVTSGVGVREWSSAPAGAANPGDAVRTRRSPRQGAPAAAPAGAPAAPPAGAPVRGPRTEAPPNAPTRQPAESGSGAGARPRGGTEGRGTPPGRGPRTSGGGDSHGGGPRQGGVRRPG